MEFKCTYMAMNVFKKNVKLQAYTTYVCCVSNRPGEIIWLIKHYVLKKVKERAYILMDSSHHTHSRQPLGT